MFTMAQFFLLDKKHGVQIADGRYFNGVYVDVSIFVYCHNCCMINHADLYCMITHADHYCMITHADHYCMITHADHCCMIIHADHVV